MTKRNRSDIMASIRETAENLHLAGTMDKRTLRRIYEACLTPVRVLSARKSVPCASKKVKAKSCLSAT